jgi:hypothetical protein
MAAGRRRHLVIAPVILRKEISMPTVSGLRQYLGTATATIALVSVGLLVAACGGRTDQDFGTDRARNLELATEIIDGLPEAEKSAALAEITKMQAEIAEQFAVARQISGDNSVRARQVVGRNVAQFVEVRSSELETLSKSSDVLLKEVRELAARMETASGDKEKMAERMGRLRVRLATALRMQQVVQTAIDQAIATDPILAEARKRQLAGGKVPGADGTVITYAVAGKSLTQIVEDIATNEPCFGLAVAPPPANPLAVRGVVPGMTIEQATQAVCSSMPGKVGFAPQRDVEDYKMNLPNRYVTQASFFADIRNEARETVGYARQAPSTDGYNNIITNYLAERSLCLDCSPNGGTDSNAMTLAFLPDGRLAGVVRRQSFDVQRLPAGVSVRRADPASAAADAVNSAAAAAAAGAAVPGGAFDPASDPMGAADAGGVVVGLGRPLADLAPALTKQFGAPSVQLLTYGAVQNSYETQIVLAWVFPDRKQPLPLEGWEVPGRNFRTLRDIGYGYAFKREGDTPPIASYCLAAVPGLELSRLTSAVGLSGGSGRDVRALPSPPEQCGVVAVAVFSLDNGFAAQPYNGEPKIAALVQQPLKVSRYELRVFDLDAIRAHDRTSLNNRAAEKLKAEAARAKLEKDLQAAQQPFVP